MIADPEKIHKKCTLFLQGNYRQTPHQYFTEMSEVVSPEDQSDQYGKGDSIRSFETHLAKLFGHEDCVFLQSGTMAQLIAMRIWTDKKNNPQIAFHPTCHLEIHEQNAYKVLHNLKAELIGEKDRLFTHADLKNLKTKPSAVIFELPQREIGGQLPTWSDLIEQIEYLKSKNIIVHLDGARVWECLPYYQKSYDQIASLFDSVYISFYKGIGAVAGSALLGSIDLIKEARIWNRRHGGNLITASPLYLSAQYNLKKRINSFESFYKKTLEIADLVSNIKNMYINPEIPQVNMFHLYVKGNREELFNRSLKTANELGVWGLVHFSNPNSDGFCKTEWYIGDATVDVPLVKIKEFLLRMVNEG